MTLDAAEIVDTDRYPVDRPGSLGYAAMVAGVRAELAGAGCALLLAYATL